MPLPFIPSYFPDRKLYTYFYRPPKPISLLLPPIPSSSSSSFSSPPLTFVLLVALPRTSCITIISLQLSASSAGELHFCKDAPYTRSVNESDVSSSCILFLFLFLFLLHMLDFFFFLNLSISLYYDEKRGGRMDGCWIGGNRANHYEYRRRRWLYLSVLYILLHFHAVWTCITWN